MTKHLRQAIIDVLATQGALLREFDRLSPTYLGHYDTVDKQLVDNCRQPFDDLAYHFAKECKKHGKFNVKSNKSHA